MSAPDSSSSFGKLSSDDSVTSFSKAESSSSLYITNYKVPVMPVEQVYTPGERETMQTFIDNAPTSLRDLLRKDPEVLKFIDSVRKLSYSDADFQIIDV